jgi:hypothetical protein
MGNKPKESINSVFIAGAFVVVLLVALFTYSIGFAKGGVVISKSIGVDINSAQNIGGLGYQQPNPISECVVYTDEVIIAEQDCESHVECAPNGVCLIDMNQCAYFIN